MNQRKKQSILKKYIETMDMVTGFIEEEFQDGEEEQMINKMSEILRQNQTQSEKLKQQ